MLEKINDLSFSKTLDSNYLLSLFHSKNIETSLKIGSIVNQYESNIDFFSVFSKAKVYKMDRSFDRFKNKLQVFISELTTQELSLCQINTYLTVVSRIVMIKSFISQINSLTEILVNAGKEYLNSLYSKEANEDIQSAVLQFNMYLNQFKDTNKKPISRMSTKSNTDKLIEDEIKGISTPKFIGLETEDEQTSFSFDGGNHDQNIIIPLQLQKEEKQHVKSINLFHKVNVIENTNKNKNNTNTSLNIVSNDRPMACLETLKIINEMFQSKLITKEDRSFLKEKLVEKDIILLSFLKMFFNKEDLITNIKDYISLYKTNHQTN